MTEENLKKAVQIKEDLDELRAFKKIGHEYSDATVLICSTKADENIDISAKYTPTIVIAIEKIIEGLETQLSEL